LDYRNSRSEASAKFLKRCVLVTGGGGFIGSHLVRRLVALGSEVVSLGGNRDDTERVDGVRPVFGNISRDTLETVAFVPETVFHLAGGSSVAASVANPPEDFLNTVYSTILLLDFLRRNWQGAQVVYVSSAAVYGEAQQKKASHDLACLPISPYGVHKRQVESLLLDHARMYGTQSVIIRPFSVYGPGLRKQLLWDALQKASHGVFNFFGSGRELRDWVYVHDLVECLLRVSDVASKAVPAFNAGSCHAVSVREILTQLFSVAGLNREPVFLGQQKEGDPDRLVADDSAEAELGPMFVTPLREGLEAYVQWYKEQGAHD
jgi:UDP-glucose 4-epimerase